MEKVKVTIRDAKSGEEKFSFSFEYPETKSPYNPKKEEELMRLFYSLITEYRGMEWLADLLVGPEFKAHVKLFNKFEEEILFAGWGTFMTYTNGVEEGDGRVEIMIGYSTVSPYIKVFVDGWQVYEAYAYEIIQER